MTDRIEVVGKINRIETIAAGPSVRVRRLLERAYGAGTWRKRKGIATVRLVDGSLRQAEVHWYEAHGRGRVDVKVKRLLS